MKAVLLSGLAILLVAASFQIDQYIGKKDAGSQKDLYRTTTVYGVIQDKYSEYEEIQPITSESEKPQLEVNKHLDKATADYLGSIEIPAIGTSDSIYRSKGDYYLNHNFNKEAYEPGEIYLDERTGNSILETGALLNGHAVPDGSKFGNFKKLLDIKEQPEVLIWDGKTKATSKYKMLFVSLIDGENSGIVMKFNDEAQRLNYYKNLYSTSITQWEEPTEGDVFLLLNSCAYIIQDGHYVVVAKKVEEE